MKLNRSKLRNLIKEELNKVSEADRPSMPWYEDHPGNPTADVEKEEAEETNEAGDAYFVMVDDLVTSLGSRVASRVSGTEDEVYIMTGQEEGITVKVVRRGR